MLIWIGLDYALRAIHAPVLPFAYHSYAPLAHSDSGWDRIRQLYILILGGYGDGDGGGAAACLTRTAFRFTPQLQQQQCTHSKHTIHTTHTGHAALPVCVCVCAYLLYAIF